MGEAQNLIDCKNLKDTISILTEKTKSFDNMDDLHIAPRKHDSKQPISMNNTPKNRDAKIVKFKSSQELILDNVEDSLSVESYKKESMDDVFVDEKNSSTTSPSHANSKFADGQNSTLNTTLVSEGNSRSSSAKREIETSVSLRPTEYSAFDKLIMDRLSGAIDQFGRLKCAPTANTDCSVLNGEQKGDDSKFRRLEKIMDVFLRSDESVFREIKFFDNCEKSGEISEFSSRAMLKKLDEFNKV